MVSDRHTDWAHRRRSHIAATRARRSRRRRGYTHSEVALGSSIAGTARQSSANLLGERVLATGAGDLTILSRIVHDIFRRLLECFPFKLDRHDGREGRGVVCGFSVWECGKDVSLSGLYCRRDKRSKGPKSRRLPELLDEVPIFLLFFFSPSLLLSSSSLGLGLQCEARGGGALSGDL